MKRILMTLIAIAGLMAVPAFAQRTGKQVAPLVTSYSLTIIVNVPGATISVDGKELLGNSVNVPAGSHTVQVSAPGYKDYSSAINVKSNYSLNVKLEPALATLTVSVNVPAFSLSVDGRAVKGNGVQVSLGTHLVKVTSPGYLPYEMNVNVNQSMTLNVNLQRDFVDLTILVNVKGAQIFVDNGQIKGNVAKVDPGDHLVKVIAPGYAPYEMNVSVNQSMTLNVNLERDLVDLTILVNVKGAQIWVDNELLKGYGVKVSPGSHQVQVQAPGYQVYLQSVVVNQSMSLNVNLERNLFSLNVSCDVKGAQILVNDVEQKFFPVQLPAGKYGIKARARGYSEYYEEITIQDDYNMRIQMRQLMGGIIVVIPGSKLGVKDAKGGNRYGTIDVWIDNQPVKLNNKDRVDVTPGSHRVKVEYEGLQAEIDIMVQSDTDYTIEPFLQLKVTTSR